MIVIFPTATCYSSFDKCARIHICRGKKRILLALLSSTYTMNFPYTRECILLFICTFLTFLIFRWGFILLLTIIYGSMTEMRSDINPRSLMLGTLCLTCIEITVTWGYIFSLFWYYDEHWFCESSVFDSFCRDHRQ